MTRHVWFRLAVRFLGMMMLLLYAPSFLKSVYYTVYAYRNSGEGAPVSSTVFSLAIDGLAVGASVYLLLGAPKLVRWCLRDVDTMCPRCGSSVGVNAESCPVCSLRLRELPGALPIGTNSPERDRMSDGV